MTRKNPFHNHKIKNHNDMFAKPVNVIRKHLYILFTNIKVAPLYYRCLTIPLYLGDLYNLRKKTNNKNRFLTKK